MSAQNAKTAAEQIVARLRLPAEAKGRKLQLVTFNCENDCRFFYPRRAVEWQRQVNTYIARAVRTRGIRVQRISLTPADYYESLKPQRRVSAEASPTLERSKHEFADQHLRLLD